MTRLPNLYRLVALLLALAVLPACASEPAVDPATLPDQVQLPLYPGDPPGEPTWDQDGPIPEMSIGDGGRYRYVHEPVLDVFHAKGENHNGAAVVICPGGGYGILAYNHEGIQVAQWLNDNGITAIILRYRMFPYRHPVPMHDVQRALQTVRASAHDWAIDPDRIGVLGFSAGGHLASTAATHFAAADEDAADPVLRVTSRPNFAVLVYPVITMRSDVTHGGSRRNLLGPDPDEALVELMSNDEQVDDNTPPTFLVHSLDDGAVPIANSQRFLAALQAHHIPGELMVFDTGGHGYGLGRSEGHETTAWPARCIEWFGEQGLLE